MSSFICNNKKSLLLYLITFQTLIIISNQCNIKNCATCSIYNSNFCIECIKGFSRSKGQCGKKCKTITNCLLCDDSKLICIQCAQNCKLINNICSCQLRYILYFVFFIITILAVGITVYCMTHNILARANINIFNNLRLIRLNNSNNRLVSEPVIINNNQEQKIDEAKLINDFLRNKIDLIDEIENKMCDCCKNVTCNIKLDCGCYVCFGCEKKLIKNNICLNCGKNFTKMNQISCSICLNNKKEMGYFDCKCKMVVCKECYIKWRLKNNNCPTCKSVIL